MSFWWLEPGWTETCCANCGAKIWPEGDPDQGVCFSCFQQAWHEQDQQERVEEQAKEKADV